MTTYKKIIGKPIKYLSTDLDNSAAEGQIWYNSTDGTFKTVVTSTAWSTSSPMLVKSRLMAGFGINTAAVSAGGANDTASIATTQEYNGTGWSLGGNLPEARFNAGGLGVETAGMSVGGGDPPGARSVKTFEYDGTSWTAGGDLSEEREGPFSFGTETAGVAAGGETLLPPGVTQTATVDEYNGSSWTAVNSMSNARYLGAACGVETAGVVFGGETSGGGGYLTATELYDGTNWTAGGNAPSSQKYAQAASGQQTDALLINGFGPPYTTAVTEYDGSSFTTGQSTAIPRSQLGASKQQSNTTSALAYGGINPGVTGGPRLTNTEEYAKSINVITAAAWASGGNLGTARNRVGGAGTQTAGLAFGGSVSPGAGEPTVANLSEEYDGSSWTEGNNLGTSRYGVQGCGIQTAALAVGGVINPNAGAGATKDTEEYDGSSWTAQPDTTNVFYLDGVAGTQTAAVIRGGAGGPPGIAGNFTEEYNGSSWSANPGTIGTARYAGSFIGTQTAAIYCGGQPPAPVGFLSDTYDGSTFSSAPSLVVQFARGGGAGTQTNALIFGPSTASVVTQQYNGTSWVTSANNATERNSIAVSPAATASAALMSGGGPGVKNNTEEFTGESSAVNVKTISTS